jgi:hypothetical protein
MNDRASNCTRPLPCPFCGKRPRVIPLCKVRKEPMNEPQSNLGELTLVLCEALDESLTQQEGWINRYCHTHYRQEHFADVAKKRAVLAAVRRQLEAMKP